MAYTSVDQLGEDQRKVVANKQQYLDAALARGMSQGRIDQFLKENPFDYHRLASQEADAAPVQTQPNQPNQPSQPSVPPPASNQGTAPPEVAAPLSGLTALQAGPAMQGSISAGGQTMGGAAQTSQPEPPPQTGVASAAIGQLRALGRRSYPYSGKTFGGQRIY